MAYKPTVHQNYGVTIGEYANDSEPRRTVVARPV